MVLVSLLVNVAYYTDEKLTRPTLKTTECVNSRLNAHPSLQLDFKAINIGLLSLCLDRNNEGPPAIVNAFYGVSVAPALSRLSLPGVTSAGG